MRAFLLLIALIIFCCPGCSVSTRDRIVGVWTPDQDATVLPAIAIPNIKRRVNNVLSKFVLKLRSDNTFVIASGGAIEGKWSLEGKTITLVPKQGEMKGILGYLLPPMKQVEVKISDDYSRLTSSTSSR